MRRGSKSTIDLFAWKSRAHVYQNEHKYKHINFTLKYRVGEISCATFLNLYDFDYIFVAFFCTIIPLHTLIRTDTIIRMSERNIPEKKQTENKINKHARPFYSKLVNWITSRTVSDWTLNCVRHLSIQETFC